MNSLFLVRVRPLKLFKNSIREFKFAKPMNVLKLLGFPYHGTSWYFTYLWQRKRYLFPRAMVSFWSTRKISSSLVRPKLYPSERCFLMLMMQMLLVALAELIEIAINFIAVINICHVRKTLKNMLVKQ